MATESAHVDVSSRRVFTVEDKRRIVGEYRAATTTLGRGEVLRKAGIYQSLLWRWSKQIDDGTIGTLRRGPAPADSAAVRARELEEQLVRAKAKIATLESLVTAQGKCLALHVEVRLDDSANSPKP
jgi:transposase